VNEESHRPIFSDHPQEAGQVVGGIDVMGEDAFDGPGGPGYDCRCGWSFRD